MADAVLVDAPKELYDPSKETTWTRLGLSAESFRRAPGTTGGQVIVGGGQLKDVDLEQRIQESPMLQQTMKPRHLQLMALAGTIGTGLFLGSGNALHLGGPGGVLIAYSMVGFVMINVLQALGEMAVIFPVSGGYSTLANKFIDPACGFALGWTLVLQWAVTLPLEITVAGMTVRFWTQSVPIGVWFAVFWTLIVVINLFGTSGFAEEELWTSCFKLLVIVIFILAAVVLSLGGGPAAGDYGQPVGNKYWVDPGPFAHGFRGVCSAVIIAMFSYSGAELLGFAASETPDPRATMPSATKKTFWRVIFVYLASLAMITLLLPADEPRLPGASGMGISPFTLVFLRAKVVGLDHLMNAAICVSVFSIGLSCVYAGSRSLTALAENGSAPKIFSYVDKAGRPLFSVVAILACGSVAFLSLTSSGEELFSWLLALEALSTVFIWGSIFVCHIRFRQAWKAQGHSTGELPFKAFLGVPGSAVCLVLLGFILVAQLIVAISPPDRHLETTADRITHFLKAYLAVPVTLLLWAGAYIRTRSRPRRAHEIDLDTGRKAWLTVEEMDAWRAERRRAPWHVRAYRLLLSG